jgi:predicted MPP superfamily phosphohydrolase
MLAFLVRATFIKTRGVRNALDIKVRQARIVLSDLPAGFDNTRILLATDLHVDGLDSLAARIISVASTVDYDFCILGGDYSFGTARQGSPAHSMMRDVATKLRAKSPVFAVLGNHDRYSIAQLLDECGVQMLMNESVCLEKDGDKIYLAGLDDCHYYGSDDIALADTEVEDGSFKILVCHSPEAYRQAAEAAYSLYLTGHTHGGQICLPGGFVVVHGATVPRRLLKGKWRCGSMAGYTSPGAGASGVAVRYFCPPEITIITLTKG